MKRVAVLGGGIGGLTAAHELAERGVEVTVYERAGCFGGKARSFPVPGTGRGGRPDLPGEHGHRVFPGFYRHLDDTMRRIPFGGRPNGVYDNLVSATAGLFVAEGGHAFVMPSHFPRSLSQAPAYLSRWIGQFTDSGLTPAEIATFVGRSLDLLVSSDERLLAEHERTTWAELMAAGAPPSPRFDELFLGGWARTFAALDATRASARTMGLTLAHMFLWSQLPGAGRTAVRVLDGPTSEAFLDPWVARLRRLGAVLETDARVEAIEVRDGRVSGVTVRRRGAPVHVEADAYVCALPVEAMRPLLTPALLLAAPSLSGLCHLQVRFMGGVQLYLDRPVPLVHGPVHYAGAPWGLTSISQAQFWRGHDLSRRGDGRTREVLSVSVADWSTPGRFVTDRPAMQCPAEVVAAEVLAQIRSHLAGPRAAELDAAELVGWSLDPRIARVEDRQRNQEPLMVNTVDSWRHRPDAATEIDNLVLASDYVRTSMDFASMEAANEAARRAVDALLERSRSPAPRCGLWPLRPPRLLEPLRRLDALRYRLERRA